MGNSKSKKPSNNDKKMYPTKTHCDKKTYCNKACRENDKKIYPTKTYYDNGSYGNDKKMCPTKSYYDTTSCGIYPPFEPLNYKPPIDIPKITCDFKTATDRYAKFVSYIESQRIIDPLVFANKISLIEKYISLISSTKKNELPIFDNYDLECIHIIHKLHPTDYRIHFNYNIPIHSSWLLKATNTQLEACAKMLHIKGNLNISDWTNKYKEFLIMIKKNTGSIIVPTLEQDFMWHSHMIHNQSYTIDCNEYFGYVLKHDDDIPEEKLKEYSKHTKVLKEEKLEEYFKYAEVLNRGNLESKTETKTKTKTKTQTDKDKPKYGFDVHIESSCGGHHNSYGDHHSSCDSGGHHTSCGDGGCAGGGGD